MLVVIVGSRPDFDLAVVMQRSQLDVRVHQTLAADCRRLTHASAIACAHRTALRQGLVVVADRGGLAAYDRDLETAVYMLRQIRPAVVRYVGDRVEGFGRLDVTDVVCDAVCDALCSEAAA